MPDGKGPLGSYKDQRLQSSEKNGKVLTKTSRTFCQRQTVPQFGCNSAEIGGRQRILFAVLLAALQVALSPVREFVRLGQG